MSYDTIDDALIGSIFPYGGNTVLSNQPWLLCDGKSIGNTGSGADYTGLKYKKLYDIIQDTFGGTYNWSGGNTVNLPDLRGLFLRGTDTGAGRDPSGCRCVGTCQMNAIEDHRHYIFGRKCRPIGWHGGGGDTCVTDRWWGSPEQFSSYEGGDETRPRNIYLNFVIKF